MIGLSERKVEKKKEVSLTMSRETTTALLGRVLKSNKLSEMGLLWAEEVTVNACHKDAKRIDFMSFKSSGCTFISDIEKGIFTCYEIKSCKEDVHSGNGLNFIGDENYLVITMQTYKDILPDINSGKLRDYVRNNHIESSVNFGVLVAVPASIDLRNTNKIFNEFTSLTEFNGDCTNWKLYKIIPCRKGFRKKSMAELLFCMLRAKHRSV